MEEKTIITITTGTEFTKIRMSKHEAEIIEKFLTLDLDFEEMYVDDLMDALNDIAGIKIQFDSKEKIIDF